MSVRAAYIAVIIVWATTPLGIKLSSAGVSIYDAALLRMLLAVVFGVLLVLVLRVPFAWRAGWRSYLAGAFGLYGGLLPVYYAAQSIPSGLISVLWGLSPVVASLMAVRWLGERALTPGKLLALLTALAGLALVFRGELAPGRTGLEGLLACLVSVLCFTYGAMHVKRLNAGLHPLAQTVGSLVLALPLFQLTWFAKDGSLPASMSTQALLALGYLAIFASVLSYVPYFYILQKLPMARVALTTLVSPVLALFLGIGLAGEELPVTALAGSAVILLALLAYHLEERLPWRGLRPAE